MLWRESSVASRPTKEHQVASLRLDRLLHDDDATLRLRSLRPSRNGFLGIMPYDSLAFDAPVERFVLGDMVRELSLETSMSNPRADSIQPRAALLATSSSGRCLTPL